MLCWQPTLDNFVLTALKTNIHHLHISFSQGLAEMFEDNIKYWDNQLMVHGHRPHCSSSHPCWAPKTHPQQLVSHSPSTLMPQLFFPFLTVHKAHPSMKAGCESFSSLGKRRDVISWKAGVYTTHTITIIHQCLLPQTINRMYQRWLLCSEKRRFKALLKHFSSTVITLSLLQIVAFNEDLKCKSCKQASCMSVYVWHSIGYNFLFTDIKCEKLNSQLPPVFFPR